MQGNTWHMYSILCQRSLYITLYIRPALIIHRPSSNTQASGKLMFNRINYILEHYLIIVIFSRTQSDPLHSLLILYCMANFVPGSSQASVNVTNVIIVKIQISKKESNGCELKREEKWP